MADHICTWCKNVFPEEELTPVHMFGSRSSDEAFRNLSGWGSFACDKCINKYETIQEQLTKNALRALGAL